MQESSALHFPAELLGIIPGGEIANCYLATRICSLISVGRCSAALSKAAMLSSKANVAEINGFRSTLPEAIRFIARRNTNAYCSIDTLF